MQQLEPRMMLDGGETFASLVNTLVPRLQTSQYQSTSLEVTPHGDTLIVFSGRGLQDDDGVFVRRLPQDGSQAGADRRVNVTVRETQQRPSVATYDDGRYVIAWDGRGPGDQQGIFARWYDADDVPLTGEVRINQITPGEQGEADVAVAGDGTTFFVWSGTGGADDPDGIFRRTFDAVGNALSEQTRVNVTTAGRQDRPAIAATPDGRSVVTWTSRGGAAEVQGVQFRLYPAADTLAGEASTGEAPTDAEPPREFSASAGTAKAELHSRVGIDDQGEFVIAWSGYTAGEDLWNIYSRRFAADGSPRDDHDRLVNAQLGGVQRDPALAMAPDGRYVISWTSGVADGSGWEVYAKVFSAAADGGAAEATTDLLVNETSGSNSGHQTFSAVAIGSGPARIAWSGAGGVDRQGVWIRHTALAERPTLVAIPPQTIDEQTELRIPLQAIPGRADQGVRFDLEPGSHPLGMVIDPRTGSLLWTPSEADGPGVFSATVIARDADAPQVADRQTVRITVREVNHTPLVAEIPDVAIDEGEAFVYLASASDPDLPENALAYALVDPPSAALHIDAQTGRLTWATSEEDGPGEYPITVRVTDNGSPRRTALETLTLTIRETNHAPQIAPVLDQQILEQQPLTVSIPAHDLDGDPLRFSLDSASIAAGMAIDDRGLLRWTPTEAHGPGVFPVTVTVRDDANLAASVQLTISVLEVNQAPRLDPLPNLLLELGQTVVAHGSATDADLPANALRYRLDPASLARGATIDTVTGEIEWTPTARGIFPITVTVTDDGQAAAHDTASFTVVVDVPFNPPLLAPVTAQTIDEQSELRFQLSAIPGGADRSVRYSLGPEAPSGMEIDSVTGLVRWTPDESQGPAVVHVSFEAFDPESPEMRDHIDVPITVREVNAPPLITVPAEVSMDEGGLMEVVVTASDPDLPKNDLRFRFTDGFAVPAGATIDPLSGLVRWQTDEATGPAMVVLSVTVFDAGNPSLSDSGTVDVTVRERNQPPTIGPIPELVIDELSTLHFRIPAFDADLPADTLVYRLDTASRAAGMTIDAAGELSWTPRESEGPKSFPVTVTVTDDALRPLSASRSFQIHVREVNRPPILDPLGSYSVRPGTAVAFAATGFDADSPANELRYSLRGDVPPGALFDGTSGDFQWTPAADAVPRVYDFTLRVTDDGTPERFDEQPVSIEVLPNHIELIEEDRFVTAYEQSIVIEPGTQALRFRLDSLIFDDSDPDSINDAFEAALVDPRGRPLAAIVAADRDAFFNQTENESILLGGGTLFSRDDTSVTITVDVSHLPTGSEARLVQRLVNNDRDDGTRVTIVPGIEQLTTSPTGEASLITGDQFPSLPGGNSAAAAADAEAFWRHLADVTTSVTAVYNYTAFDLDSHSVAAGLTLTNSGSYPVRGPLLVAVTGIDLLQAELIDFSGQLPLDEDLLPDELTRALAGAPYYDVSTLLSPAGLLPGEAIDLQLRFSNPTLHRFDYQLHVLGGLNAAPAIDSSPPTSLRLGSEYVYAAAATDPDQDALQYELVSGPAEMVIDSATGRLAWTPGPQDLGRHRVVLRVADPFAAEDSLAFEIEVRAADAPNRSPVFSSVPTVDAYVGREYLYRPQASDPDFDPLSFSVVTGPEGFTIGSASGDPSSGRASWTPSLDLVGRFVPVTLEVEDQYGGRATQSYRVYVHPDPDNLPPVIVTAPETSLRLPALDVGPAIGDVAPQAIERLLPRGASYTTPVSITLPAGAHPRSADIVLVVDESSSMEEQTWVADVIAQLEASLAAEGIDDNRYAIIGYGAAVPEPRIVTGENDYVISVYGPAGGVLDSFRVIPGEPLPEIVFPTDGTYRIAITQYAVKASPSTPGGTDRREPQNYRFTPTIGESPAGPGGEPRSGWGTHQGSLSSGSGRIEVTAAAGDLVLIDGVDGEDVRIEIVDDAGRVLLSERPLLDDPDPFIFPRSANYQVRLSGPSSATYQLRLLDPIADAVPLVTGGSTAGTLSDPDAIDLYRLDAAAGFPLFIDALFLPAENADTGFPELRDDYGVRVLGPDGSFVGGHAPTPTQSEGMFQSLPLDVDPFVLSADGTYTLVVSRSDSYRALDPIPYAFAAHDLSGSHASIAAGQTVTSSLAEPTATNVYEISLDSGDSLSIEFLTHSGGATTWQVLDPFGLPVASGRGSSINGGFSQLPIRTSGRYKLLVQGHAANIHPVEYSFGVSVGSTSIAPAVGIAASWDAPIVGDFGSSNAIRYVVDLERDETFFATLVEPGPTAARMRILAPSGGLVWDSGTLPADGGVEEDEWMGGGPSPDDPETPAPPPPRSGLLSAMQSGRYVIELQRTAIQGSAAASEYVFQLARGASPLVLDQPLEGVVDPGGGLSVFAFDATAGQTLSLEPDMENFTDAETAAERAADLRISGAREDGYWAIEYALDRLEFRELAARQMILLTDEERVVLQPELSRSMIEASLREHQIDLHTITDIRFRDEGNLQEGDALGIVPLPLGAGPDAVEMFYADGQGGFESSLPESFDAYDGFRTTEQDYVELASALGGTSWSIGELRDSSASGELQRESFTRAFVSTLTDVVGRDVRLELVPTREGAPVEIGEPSIEGPRIEGPSIGEASLEGPTVTFPVTFSGDGDAWDFGLEFVDPRNPGILYGSVPVALAAGYRYELRAIDPEQDPVSYALIEGQGASFDAESGTLLWSPAAAGEYEFAVSASDPLGGVDVQRWTVAVEPVDGENTPPTLEPIADLEQSAGRSLTLDLSASDPDGDSLSYQLLPGTSTAALPPAGLTLDPTSGRLSWRPTLEQVGEHEITVRVVDGRSAAGRSGIGAEGSTRTFTIRVVPIQPHDNARPVITSEPASAAVIDHRFRYAVDAYDPDEDLLRYELSLAPEGMVIDAETGVLSWVPSDGTAGMHQVIVRVADAFGGVTLEAFSLEVFAANDAPQIVSAPESRATVGESWSYQLQAEDPSGDLARFEIVTAPEGMVLDPSSGLLRWTPTAAGQFALDVRAIDDDGGEDTQRIELTVIDPAQNTSPRIVGSPRDQWPFDRLYVWRVPAVDSEHDALSFELVSGPEGLTLDSHGLLQWTPDASQVTTDSPHEITVRVDDSRGGTAAETWRIDVGHTAQNRAPQMAGEPSRVAVAGRVYEAQFAATDSDGDTIFWSTESAPLGMQIDLRGTVRWQPTLADMGSHRVTVRASDTAGGFDTYSFTLEVRGSNHPAIIQGTPPTHHRRGNPYETTFTASDVDGDVVRFQFAEGSETHGGSLDAETGRMQWTPAVDGVYRFEVSAVDSLGDGSSLEFAVHVDFSGPNSPPQFEFTAPGVADAGRVYSRQFPATDPDGDALTYAVSDGPAGMEISADGTVTWTPPVAAVGAVELVELIAIDPGGLAASYRFHLPVLAPNRPPEFTSTPPTAPGTAGQVYRYDVTATDPDRDRLTYSLVSGPEGLSLDPSTGRVTWLTESGDIGEHSVQVAVSDGRLDAAADEAPLKDAVVQTWTIEVRADVTEPQVALTADRLTVEVGEEVVLRFAAIDDVAVENRRLYVNQTAITIDAAGYARHRFAVAGRYTVSGEASDAVGNSAADSLEILVRDPDNAAPRPLILSPAMRQRITAPQDVTISVADAEMDVTAVRLLVAPLDGSAPFQQIASHTAAVGEVLGDLQNFTIGRFDPTILANGRYILRLVAEDAGFNSATADQIVSVEGRLKLGNFQLALTDLTIPVAGIPITVVRRYDTLAANRSGDFGHGWSLEVLQATVSVDRNTLGSLGSGRYQAFVDGTRVRVRTPAGTEEGFTFRAVPDQTFFGVVLSWKAHFDPDPGNSYALTASSGSLKKLGNEYVSSFGTTYNPADPEFGGRYQLKSFVDRQTYTIDAATGRTESVEDPGGNRLTFTSNGIFSNRGRSVTFDRDMQGRIARITDPRGNSLHYSYDSAGDLVAFTDRMDNTTRMTYHNSPAHFLDTIIDPLGNVSVKANYGNGREQENGNDQSIGTAGRLESLTDASGVLLDFDYDTENLSQTTSDSQGVQSFIRFDDQGNPIEEASRGGDRVVRTYDDPATGLPATETQIVGLPDSDSGESDDQTLSRVFNRWGQITSETDNRGNVTRYEYAPTGAPIATIDPLGRTTSFEYDGLGQLTNIRSAFGEVTHLAYNDFGQVIEIRSGGSSAVGGNADDPTGGSAESVGPPSVRLRYDRFGDLQSLVDAEQRTRSMEYDENGNRTRTEFVWTDPLDSSHTETVATSVIVAPNDQPQTVQTPAGTTQTTFDSLNRPAQTIDQNGYITEKIYDRRGLTIETRTQTSDAAGALVWLVSRTVYDDQGRAIYTADNFLEGTPVAEIDGTHTIYNSDGRVAATERLKGLQIAILDRGSATPSSTLVSAGITLSTATPFYDAAGRVWKSVDHVGRESQVLYDDFGQAIENRSQAVNERGDIVWMVTRTAYDSFGRVTFRTDRFRLPGDTLLGKGVSGPVSTSHTIYDSMGRVTGTQRVANSTVAIVDGETVLVEAGELVTQSRTIYDDSGRVARRISSSGEITDFLYDSRGRQIASIGHPLTSDSVGLGERYPGKLVRLRSEVEFDAHGQQSVQRNGVIQIENADGTLVQVDYADARETAFHYDHLGRLTRTIFPDGTSKSTEYDAQGRVVAEIDPQGFVRRFAYSSQGQLIQVMLPETFDPITGERVAGSYQYEYDGQGNQTLIRDPLGRETRFTYDATGLQQTRTLPLGHGADGILGTADDAEVSEGGWSERFGYDQRGRRSYHVSFEGVVTQTIYDDASESSDELPTGRVEEKRFFDRWESFVASPNAPDEVWKYRYDAFGREVRVDQIDHRGESSVTRTTLNHYDAAGRLIQHVTPEGILNYTYNHLGQKTATLVGDPAAPVRSTEYTYDPLGRLETVTERTFQSGGEDTEASHRYFYDLEGKVDAELAANGLFKDYVYNALNQLEHLIHYRTDGSIADIRDLSDNQELARFDYTLLADGRREKSTETWWRDSDGDGQLEPFTASYSYAYDELGRLTDEVFDHWDDQLDYHDTYLMDLVGNRLSKHRDLGADSTVDQTVDYQYDANDRLIHESTRAASGEVEAEVRYGYIQTQNTAKTFVDKNGVVQQTHHYEYDLQGRQRSATVTEYDSGAASTMSRTTYRYDHMGIRVSSLTETDANSDGVPEIRIQTDHLVDHNNFTGYPQVVREVHSDAATGATIQTVDYTYGNDELTQTTTAFAAGAPSTVETYTFLHDAHGSVRALLDAAAAIAISGTQPQIYFYDAYGNLQGPSTPLTTLLYNGEQFDTQTEQQYLRARYYNPSIGRFNRLDPFSGNRQEPQSYHKYAYAHNDPIQGVDPSGKFTLSSSMAANTTSAEMRGAKATGTFATARRVLLRVGWNLALARAVLEIESLQQHVVPIPRQKVLADYDYALLAAAGYENADLGAVQSRGWQELFSIFNGDTGFHATLFERQGERVLSFAGTVTFDDWRANIQQGLFGDAAQYQQAVREARSLERDFGRIDRFVGHSLGGGLASAAAIVHSRPATTFNAAGVNPHFVDGFGATLAGADRLIDAYRVRGEILTTLQDASFGWSPAPWIGISAIGHIGEGAPDSVGRNLWLEGSSFSMIVRHFMSEVFSGMRKMM